MDAFDVVVVGGGPAGGATATTAARAGASVLLVDDAPADRTFRVGESLPPGGADVVARVFGSSSGFEAFEPDDHVRCYGNRSVWGHDRPLDTDFLFNPFGAGWHLDRVAFDGRLLLAAEAAGVEVLREARVVRAQRDGDSPWMLTGRAAGGSVEVRTPLVVDATGRRAAIARDRGAQLVVEDRLVAMVALLDPTEGSTWSPLADRDTFTTVEAVEDGWWYTAAVPGDRRVLAFQTDGDLLDPALRSVDGVRAALARTTHVGPLLAGRLDDGQLPAAPMVVAAGTTHLVAPVGDGWLAVGDAAAAFDPLSSQGILTALVMGEQAGQLAAAPEPETAAAYVAAYDAVLTRFRAERDETYALERRWPDAPFWARRTRR